MLVNWLKSFRVATLPVPTVRETGNPELAVATTWIGWLTKFSREISGREPIVMT